MKQSKFSNNQNRNNSAILPNGRINVSFLQREIMQDLVHDAKYYAEDEMKKKAILTSKDYDEFKNFVSCSQLKPVNGSEMGQLFVQRSGAGSTTTSASTCRRNNDGDDVTVSDSKKTLYNKVCQKYDNAGHRRDVLLDAGSQEFDPNPTNIEKVDTGRNDDFLDIFLKQKSKTNTNSTNASTSANIDSIVKTKKKIKSKSQSNSKRCNGIPRNTMEFEREWKQYCSSVSNILNYLCLPMNASAKDISNCNSKNTSTNLFLSNLPQNLRIEPEYFYQTICKVEIDSTIMGAIIKAMEYFLSSCLLFDNDNDIDNVVDDDDIDKRSVKSDNSNRKKYLLFFIYRWISSLTKCGRFSLSSEFITKDERKCLSSILDILESNCKLYNTDNGNDDCDGIASNNTETGFNRDDIANLRKMYNMK
mmetsp:Transcript_28863/g.33543  ORF Transcript_28863/g.33543 Transcript_28863/m.33543 type:complete len:418 (-) Transcript_28863:163-1416(-)